ncbi:MAG: hypothetical protein E7501_00965 [Ruminococcus sp.]|nr:hypothetical protein [Ruminococcus sp.]
MKRVKGSALLWAVGVLAVMLIVVSGVLALSESYAQAELREIAESQAISYARAGIELTAAEIESGDVHSALIPQKQMEQQIIIEMETGACTVTIYHNAAENRLELSASSTVGDVTETLCAEMTAYGGGFRFDGFTGN